jgi:hypothetical protein
MILQSNVYAIQPHPRLSGRCCEHTSSESKKNYGDDKRLSLRRCREADRQNVLGLATIGKHDGRCR